MVRQKETCIGAQLVARFGARGRPPGKRCLTVLGGIAQAHLAGQRWHPRTAGYRFCAEFMQQRAIYAKRLAQVYWWVIGDAQAGYQLARCPLCQVATCHGSKCQADQGLAT